ncbi:class I SAM-dependent methyltransferase [Aestuariivivens sediminicola]|uniref:class I SAM-dependent methyltransferase n=1 Tax=Aestuariivivens sediminicola TaxID=2913560 RepID=UPI001F57E5A2|nr:methyltransferase domain-containing protein [Aestuariivivens sediminicola]
MNIEYVPCDLQPELFRYRGSSKIHKVDITNIPFENNSFDFILCSHVLEHVPNDKLAMKELNRVLRNDGFGIFMVPIDYNRLHTYEDQSITTPEGRLRAYNQSDHVRVYGLDYVQRLEDSGFEVIQDNYVKRYSPDDIFKYGFSHNDIIYRCFKRPIT